MKRYLITSAQKGATPNKEFLETLEGYAKHNSVNEIIVLPMAGKSITDEVLHPYLQEKDYSFISSDHRLNDKIKISNYEIKPQQINPTTGLARFAKADISTIFASPKQVYQPIPNHSHKVPKVLLTTGACTHPRYNMNNRIGRIAERDHEYGAILVETGLRQEYNFRHLKGQKNGKLIDLNYQYDGTHMTKTQPEVLILGDLHNGCTNKKVEKANFQMIHDYKPKKLVLHDVFDGSSISHHEMGQLVTRAQKHNQLNLEKEIKSLHDKLHEYSKAMGNNQIYIVKSNHDEFLDRYLQAARFVDEPQNAYFASKVLTAMIEGYDPLEYSMSMVGTIPKNVTFLSRDEDFTIRGLQLGNHGDKGANGSRGSFRSLEAAFGGSVTGHGHAPYMSRNLYRVGTSTNLDLGYNVGLSNWMNCFSADTEILTKNGWKTFSQLQSNKMLDQVATMNKTTRKLEFQKINTYVKKDSYTELLSIKTKTFDLLVTPDHGIIFESPHGKLHECRARDFPTIKQSKWFSSLKNSVIEQNQTDLRMLVWILTDGSIHEGRYINWGFKKERKIVSLTSLLSDYGYKFTTHVQKSGTTTIRLSTADSKRWIEQLSINKTMPDNWSNLNKTNALEVLNEYAITDGCYSGRKTYIQLSTAKKRESDILQTMCVTNGIRCHVLENNGIYILSINLRDGADKVNVSSDYTDVSTIPYSGYVWCLSVDNGTLLIRRNGKVVVTQNSHCMVYKNGKGQLINIINGKYKV